MSKVPYERLDHVISTGKSGKGNNKRDAFDDFSNLISLRDHMRKTEPKQEFRKKTHKKNQKPYGTDIKANCTHILIPCEPRSYKAKGGHIKTVNEQWIILDRVVPVDQVRGMYPNVMELMYSRDEVAFSDDSFKFANVK